MTWVDLMRPLRGRAKILIVCSALGALLSFFFAFGESAPVHTLTEVFYVKSNENTANIEADSTDDDADQAVNDLLSLIEQVPFQQGLFAAEEDGAQGLEDQRVGIAVSNEPNTRLLEVTLTGPDESTLAGISDRLTTAIDESASILFDDIEVLSVSRSEEHLEGAQTIRLNYIAYGLIVGFLVGVAVSFISTIIHPRIWDSRQLDSMECPVLGTFIDVK